MQKYDTYICVGRDENKSSCPRAAILKTEEALGGREHAVCRHLEFEGIVVNTSSKCRETVKNCVH